MTEVVVVTGMGGMGVACARRLGGGRHLVIADFDEGKLRTEADRFAADGFAVTAHAVDVSDRESVASLAAAAGSLGTLRTLVHTAWLSPTQASAAPVLEVDMPGTDFGATYSLAKRINQLRVEQAATAWGKRGGRVVSISPGIISTPMGRQELEEGSGEQMQGMLDISPVPRIGTAEDIAQAVEWLAGPSASFVSGCDLRVDGGVTAAIHGFGVGFGVDVSAPG